LLSVYGDFFAQNFGSYVRNEFSNSTEHVFSSTSLRNIRITAVTLCVVGSLLTSFLVDNKHDQQIIEQIKRKVCTAGPGPPVLIGKYVTERFDVSRHKAQTEHPTLDQVIEVDDSVVYNQIIDQVSV